MADFSVNLIIKVRIIKFPRWKPPLKTVNPHIDEMFGNNQVYQNKPENVLNNCADQFIHEHDVLFNWR